MSPTEISLLGIGLLLFLLVSSMPVGLAMAVAGIVGFAVMTSPEAALNMAAAEFFGTFSKYDLSTIPLFILMGQVAFHTGISQGLFHAAYRWLGHWRGGLAMSTVGACAAFGAICGSGPATAATMAAVALPEMRRYKYSMELATGCVAAGGSLGMMIPPSIVFIVYAILTQQSIGKLFIAGVAPGIFTAILFCLAIALVCRHRPEMGPAGETSSWRERLISLKDIIEILVIFVAVMGSMFAGYCTATEAAAIGAAATLGVGWFKKRLTWAALKQCLWETIRTSCMVIVIVAGALIFGRFLAVTHTPAALAEWIGHLPLPPWGIMAAIILFYLVAGCFVDALALNLLTIPIFYPVVVALHFDLIWFGVIIVLVTQMGVITPPVGVNAYVVSGMARDVPLPLIFRGALPFLVCLLVVAALMVIFPQGVLFLPSLLE
ncbi:TRAP transporter large permease [Fontisphaera persica]|uniref:TRAP transporter large permease n=1 Tax=Fontisphaera persica TaxID=2974023 RepID=UPI0024C0C037|nr:TRAP transporter large permease [Fontisphaera persica]WCJ59725.1 TRAP transporter large permease [Fontisphaera persica]